MKMNTKDNVLSHKGYYGSIDYDLDSKMLYGQLLGIKGVYIYEGQTLAELEADFKEFVEDYILSFEEKGEKAPKPDLGSFNVRIGMDLHFKASETAKRRGQTLNSFIKQAIEHELNG
jgi:predicted HicB family RNase H-like nuclease